VNPQKLHCTQAYQLLSEKRSSHYASLPAVFNPLPTSIQIEKYLKSNCVIKVAKMKNTKIFYYKEEAITSNHRIDTFLCQQK